MLSAWSPGMAQTDSTSLKEIAAGYMAKAEQLREVPQYDSAAFYFNQARQIYETHQRYTPWVLSLARLASVYADMGAYARADSLLEKAFRISEAHLTGKELAVGKAYFQYAYLLSLKRQHPEAEAAYQKTLENFTLHYGAESQEVAEIYAAKAPTLAAQLDKKEEAAEHFLSSFALYEKLDMGESLDMARALNDYGNFLYDEQDYEGALAHQQQCEKIQRAKLSADHPEIGVTSYNLARCLVRLGDFAQAATYYKTTLDIDRKSFGGNHPWVAGDMIALGETYRRMGKFEEALTYVSGGWEIFASDPQQFASDMIDAIPATVEAYKNTGQWDQADAILRKGMHLVEQLERDPNSLRQGKILANFYGTYAEFHINQGDYPAALQVARQGQQLFLETLGPDHADNALPLQTIGAIFRDYQQDYDQASRFFKQALQIQEKVLGTDHPDLASAYRLLGELAAKQNRPDSALYFYQQGLQLLAPGYTSAQPQDLPKLDQLRTDVNSFRLLYLSSEALQMRFRDSGDQAAGEQALAYLDLALQYAARLRKNQPRFISLQDRYPDYYLAYANHIALCFDLYTQSQEQTYLEAAFLSIEGAKAFSLQTRLQEVVAQAHAGLPPELLDAEEAFKVRQAYYRRRLETAQLAGEASQDWQQKYWQVGQQLDSLRQVMAEAYPAYYQLAYQPLTHSLSRLQQEMTAQQRVLNYYQTDSALYLLDIQAQSVSFYRTALPDNFSATVQALRQAMTQAGPWGDFQGPAESLYAALLASVALQAGQSLIVVPHGETALIPFELLLEPGPSASPNRNFLLRQHAISYGYAATQVFGLTHRPAGRNEAEFLAFVPTFQGNPMAEAAPMHSPTRDQLVDLPGSREEVAGILSLIQGRLFEGAAATEQQFKVQAGQARFLHLATHAIIDPSQPMNSRILFSPGTDSTEDGDMHAWELYNMRLQAEMAVLAACNTGMGTIQRGEGVLSLGHAFAYAGCPSVIMSLWPAQDAATSKVMIYFYENLMNQLPKDEALRQAKLTFLEESEDLFAHPFYWGGFIVQGEAGPLSALAWYQSWIFWLGLLGLLVLGGIVLDRKSVV